MTDEKRLKKWWAARVAERQRPEWLTLYAAALTGVLAADPGRSYGTEIGRTVEAARRIADAAFTARYTVPR